jgi:hypothetical protein
LPARAAKYLFIIFCHLQRVCDCVLRFIDVIHIASNNFKLFLGSVWLVARRQAEAGAELR